MVLLTCSPLLSPQFEIVPEEDPQNAIVASSALTCHSNLLKAIASVRYQSSPQRPGFAINYQTTQGFCVLGFCVSLETFHHMSKTDIFSKLKSTLFDYFLMIDDDDYELSQHFLLSVPSLWRPSCRQERTSSASHTPPSRISSRAVLGHANVASEFTLLSECGLSTTMHNMQDTSVLTCRLLLLFLCFYNILGKHLVGKAEDLLCLVMAGP